MSDQIPSGKMVGDASSEIAIPEKDDSSFANLSTLRNELFAPFAGLLLHYLNLTNSNKARGQHLYAHDFRKAHPFGFKGLFILDALVRCVFLLILISAVIRGLGLESFYASIYHALICR